jgi:hypothetical protein
MNTSLTAAHYGSAVSPLEGFKAHEWVCFERALVVRDLFTGGVRTFFSTADAQHFRARLYQHYGTQASASSLRRLLPHSCLIRRRTARIIQVATIVYGIVTSELVQLTPNSQLSSQNT